ncbi:DUF1992 domain-containing protein [Brachybacterium endophyticum]|uniref:DUF1992 domain-containing protein n=1 Tax=Brachybacterium endophyticum TaxID=2182385 RepID=A0A2U2RNN5_9MICO|nr:DUF1992 domain-containing protein [Brachybacterium endophyticum]PWH07492.1 DUF1992 domain-containing protein [Brachybacterium endophyticum]
MVRDSRWVDGAIEDAIARGDFDDLPGSGKPLELGTHHDPDWWIKQRIAEGEVDPAALLPTVVLLQREFAARDETLVELPDEEAVRAYAEDFTERVMDDRLANPNARMIAPTLEIEPALARWRELRAEREAEERARLEERAALPGSARMPWWRRVLGSGGTSR